MKTTINQQLGSIRRASFWYMERRREVAQKKTNEDLSDQERAGILDYLDEQIAALADAAEALRVAYRFRKQVREFLAWEPVEMEDTDEGEEESVTKANDA